jgi:Uma2 family endonuclease
MVAVLQPEVRKFSVAEYYRLAETGVLLPSERVELLNGQIIRMAPIGEKHRTIVDKLNYVLVDKPRKRYQVSIDQPIRIEDFNEPQPDVVLYKRGVENRHPTPEDIYLVIEVADTTLDYDSGDKLRAYEKGGIREYWIFDLGQKTVNIYKLPPQKHIYTREAKTRGFIAPQAFPDVTVDLADIFSRDPEEGAR